MARKDGDPKKIKKSELDKYKSEGYKFITPGKSETGVSQEYYELPGKKRPTPPSKLPGSDTPGKKIPVDPKKYEGDLIKMIEDGYDPRELPPSVLDPSRTPEFMKYYKPKVVYTEPDPTTVSPIPLTKGLRVEKKIISNESDAQPWRVESHPDPNKMYSGETLKYFVGNQEINKPMTATDYPNPNKLDDYSTGKFVARPIVGSLANQGANLGTVQPDAS